MILLTTLRLIRSVWVEARAMRHEVMKRFPYLRED